jgi:tRNA(Ile)-lysidine synthase
VSLSLPAWFLENDRDQHFLAAVSGGADSVALLHLLHQADFRQITVCHLHHHLRGQEADGDADFVAALAASLGYRWEIGHADIPELMEKNQLSLETAARRARHSFFGECSVRHACPRILLAHHCDDQAETVLWNLIRGSRSESGIRTISRMEVEGFILEFLRPLLGVRRKEIRDFLMTAGLVWREDHSNSEPIAARNRLRHEVLPLLDEIARRETAPLLARAAESAEELREIEQWAVTQANVLDPQGRLHVTALKALPQSLQAACMMDFLKKADIPDLGRPLVLRCLELLHPDGPFVVNLPGGGHLRRRAGRVSISG